MFNRYPYTDAHQLNLDWVIKQVKKIPSLVAAAVPVKSVNGKIGIVVLDAADVGAKPASYSAPVDSVNGQTGAVVLDAADVEALPDTAIDTTVITANVTTSDLNSKIEITNWQVKRSGRTVMIALWFNLSADADNGELLFKINNIQNALTLTVSTFNSANNEFGVLQLTPQSDMTTVNVTSSGVLKQGYYWIFNIMFIMREGT